MKNRNWERVAAPALLCLLFLCTSFLSTAVKAASTTTIKVGLYENNPKIFTDTNGNAAGFWPDIINYMASQQGWKIEYVPGTWSEGLVRLGNGEIDVMPDVAFNESRSALYAFSQELVYASWSRVYTRKGTKIESVLDLEGKNVAVLGGSVNVEGTDGIKALVKAFNINCTFNEVNDYATVFDLVKSGKADAGVASKDFGYRFENEYNLVETSIVFQPSNLYFAFPKNSALTPNLINTIDTQMKTLKANPDSVYYLSLNKWFAQASASKVQIPRWVIWIIAGIAGLILFLAAVGYIFRSQLRLRTKELKQEINKHKQAEESIRQSEAKYATLVEQSNDGIMIIEDNNLVFANQKLLELTGYTMEAALGKPFIDLLTPKYQQLATERNRRRMAGQNEPERYAAEIAARDGKIVPVEINASVIEYEGKPATMAVVRDMTEQNQTWAELRDRETRLSIILNNVSDVIFVIDAEPNSQFRFKSVNRRFLEVTGLMENQIVGKLVQEVIPEPSLTLVLGKYKEAISTGHTVTWEEISQYPGGTRYGEVAVAPVMDPQGKYTHIIGTVHDLTERHQAEITLRESEEKFRQFFENSKVICFMVSPEGIILEVNMTAIERLGYDKSELIGQRMMKIYAPESLPIIKELAREWNLTGVIPDSELVMLTKSGERRNILLSTGSIRNKEGKLVSTVSIYRDLTELKQSQQKAAQVDILTKLNQARSELLSEVAHELRTPMQSIKGFIETLMETDVKWSQEQQMEFLAEADKEIDILNLLIRDLLDMSRIESGKMKLEKQNYGLQQIIDSAKARLTVLTANHFLKVPSDPGLPEINVDKMRIAQVITNLVENATKFSEPGSTINIDAGVSEDQMVISVTDQGSGMTQETIEKLFTRFYQGEQGNGEKKKGTGLGLSICRGIVEAHGGKIWVESSPGKGSKFNFSIPLIHTN